MTRVPYPKSKNVLLIQIGMMAVLSFISTGCMTKRVHVDPRGYYFDQKEEVQGGTLSYIFRGYTLGELSAAPSLSVYGKPVLSDHAQISRRSGTILVKRFQDNRVGNHARIGRIRGGLGQTVGHFVLKQGELEPLSTRLFGQALRHLGYTVIYEGEPAVGSTVPDAILEGTISKFWLSMLVRPEFQSEIRFTLQDRVGKHVQRLMVSGDQVGEAILFGGGGSVYEYLVNSTLENMLDDAMKQFASEKFDAIVGVTRDPREALAADRDWQVAIKENTIPAYASFLKAHPSSQHAPMAKKAIEAMEADRDWHLQEASQAKASVNAVSSTMNSAAVNRQTHEATPKADPSSRTGHGTFGEQKQVLGNAAFPPGTEQHVNLGKCVLSLGSVMLVNGAKGSGTYIDFLGKGGASIAPGADEATVIKKAEELLSSGADPNYVKIHGFVAPQKKIEPFTTTYTGSLGMVVPANHDGVSLLQFCTDNGFTACADILKKHGAK